MSNFRHNDECMEKHTVGDTTTLPGTADTPNSQGTTGTANPPYKSYSQKQTEDSADSKNNQAQQTAQREQFYKSHNTSDTEASQDSQRTSKHEQTQRHRKASPESPGVAYLAPLWFDSLSTPHARRRVLPKRTDDQPHDRRLHMSNDIDGNHNHYATTVLFL